MQVLSAVCPKFINFVLGHSTAKAEQQVKVVAILIYTFTDCVVMFRERNCAF